MGLKMTNISISENQQNKSDNGWQSFYDVLDKTQDSGR